MLTVAARKAITELATRILADKLVPAEVLALIPAHVPLVIAKKYPGNAEGAQAELMQEALECARRGEIVVRVSRSSLASRVTSYFTPCSEVKTRRSFPVRPRGRRGSFL
jgi:siroheme synthase